MIIWRCVASRGLQPRLNGSLFSDMCGRLCSIFVSKQNAGNNFTCLNRFWCSVFAVYIVYDDDDDDDDRFEMVDERVCCMVVYITPALV